MGSWLNAVNWNPPASLRVDLGDRLVTETKAPRALRGQEILFLEKFEWRECGSRGVEARAVGCIAGGAGVVNPSQQAAKDLDLIVREFVGRAPARPRPDCEC